MNAAALLVLRIGTGLLMALSHGWGKLSSFGTLAETFPDPLGVGSAMSLSLTVFAEFFCSLALVFGLFTRAATIPLLITMLVAVFIIHGDDPFQRKELGVLFIMPLLTLLLAGAGRYSLDNLLTGRKAVEAVDLTR
jgi:putative oxidoreductase